jgi:hypothetical protein
MVIVIVSDFLAFVLMHTQKNESQEYQIFGREFWRKNDNIIKKAPIGAI